MEYKMIVLDLDGTLTNSQKIITEPTKEALFDIQKKGYKVVLASGRPTQGIVHLAHELRLAEYGGYILSFNGSCITDCRTEKVVYEKVIPAEWIGQIYDKSVEYGTGIMTYKGDTLVSSLDPDRYIQKEARVCRLKLKPVEDFKGYVDFAPNKCVLTGEPDHLAQVVKKMQHHFNGLMSIYRSEPYFIEIVPQNIDKAHSLLKLLSSLGLTADEMICCGDGYNDISMIECAGLGVAMENAQDVVKEVADYITKSNDEDGVLHVIQKYFK